MSASLHLLTAREIAEELEAPLHRVQYVLRFRSGEIPPTLRASQTRLYPPEALARVRAALKGIDARRATRTSDPLARAFREQILNERGAPPDPRLAREEAADAPPQ